MSKKKEVNNSYVDWRIIIKIGRKEKNCGNYAIKKRFRCLIKLSVIKYSKQLKQITLIIYIILKLIFLKISN